MRGARGLDPREVGRERGLRVAVGAVARRPEGLAEPDQREVEAVEAVRQRLVAVEHERRLAVAVGRVRRGDARGALARLRPRAEELLDAPVRGLVREEAPRDVVEPRPVLGRAVDADEPREREEQRRELVRHGLTPGPVARAERGHRAPRVAPGGPPEEVLEPRVRAREQEVGRGLRAVVRAVGLARRERRVGEVVAPAVRAQVRRADGPRPVPEAARRARLREERVEHALAPRARVEQARGRRRAHEDHGRVRAVVHARPLRDPAGRGRRVPLVPPDEAVRRVRRVRADEGLAL